jgi:hypothetical protein
VRQPISFLLVLATLATPLPAQDVGPAPGALVIVGGGLRDQAIIERFIELAGGPDAPIVVIPTDGDEETWRSSSAPTRSR